MSTTKTKETDLAARVEFLEQLLTTLVKSPEVAEQKRQKREEDFRNNLTFRVGEGERELAEDGEKQFLVEIRDEPRMPRVVAARDDIHAVAKYQRHFGINHIHRVEKLPTARLLESPVPLDEYPEPQRDAISRMQTQLANAAAN